jgi:uncharacterized repeat protein (TIGR01451 family)
VDGGGILHAKDAKNSIISWNVSISGLTTLDNATWEMNCTYDGQYKIEVTPSGNLQVINGSLITAHDTDYRYDFWVNGTATFKNCTIEYVGYSFDQGSFGVLVTTDSVQFDNVIFNNCTGGIIAFASHPQISNIESNNCTITIALFDADTLSITNVTVRDIIVPPGEGAAAILIENYSSVSLYDIDIRRADTGASGIMFVNSSDGYVENAYIQNVTAGFNIDDSQVYITDSQTLGGHSGIRVFNGADVTITDCQITYNSDVGIDYKDSAGSVYNCTISNNNKYGINLNNSSPTIEECDILSHELGIIASNSSSPFVVNSTISSTINDFHVESDSHPVALNCTFTNSSTNIWDTSTLTVQWFLHIEVQNILNNPLPGVNVRVEDNVNGTFDSSYTTDGTGRVNWIIITEYIENSTEWQYFTPYTLSAWNATHYGTRMGYIWESMLIVVTLDSQAELVIGKIVDKPTALVGDSVTYTVWYNYTGLFDLTDVYLNDTFDLSLEYQSDTSSLSPDVLGNSYSWFIGNVTPGNHSFDIVLNLLGGVSNGTLIQNDFEFQYSDENYLPQTPITSNFVSTSALAAEITVEKSVENSSINLGGYNTYTIWYNNTGGAAAQILWINDTFHTNLTIISNSDLANWMGSGWEINNVAPGSYSITVVVQLDPWDGLYGLLIPNQAISDFFDFDFTQRPQVPSNFANFTVIEEPNVDYIRLELFDGTLVTDGTILTADEDIILYARAYNFTTGFVGNVSATWTVSGAIGILNVSVGPTITFNATTVNLGNISAIYGSFDNATGEIIIIPGAVADVKIDPPGPETYSADDTILYVASGYDSHGNLNTTWVPQWSWTGAGLGDMTLITPDGYNNSIEFNITGNDVVRVFVQGSPSIFNTSDVEVIAGKVVNIVVLPIGAEFNTTDEVLNFTVLGYDANGNLNTSWIPDANWQGPALGLITVNGYTIEVDYTTVGFSTFNVTDSSDPSIYNDTKSVTVDPGVPYQISYISGNGQFGFPSSPIPTSFVVLVEDADGNPVPGVKITWDIDNFPPGATGQSLSNPTSLTNISGEAQSLLTLGDMPGFYFVNATNATFTLIGEPVSFSASALSYMMDDIIIGDAFGDPITDLINTTDHTVTLYAWAYNKTVGILGQIAVNWSSDGGVGTFTTPVNLQTQITFDFTTVGAGNISVIFENATLTLTTSTGTIEVFPGAVTSILLTPSSLTRTTDDTDFFYAIGYDSDGNENWSWSPQWSWEAGGLGTLVQLDLYNYSVSYDMIGSDSINVSLAGFPGIYDTSGVLVNVGQVIRIEMLPWNSTSATADDIGTFSVMGFDAHGFVNWSWIPSWSWIGVGLGDLTQVDLYNYTVDYNLTGSDMVFVNVLGDLSTFNSTDVYISAGAVVTITIIPSSETATTDDSGSFSIIGYDSDGNENWFFTPIWQWEGPGLGALTQIDPYNYSVEYNSIGLDGINVTVSGNPTVFTISDISISVGEIAKIEITPWPAIDNETGDSIDISVMGYDADSNENWQWTPIWTWEGTQLGTLTQVTLYNYTVTFTAEGTDAINVSSTTLPSIFNRTIVTIMDIITQPTIDYIAIMNAPGGSGNFVDTESLGVGDTLKLYAVGFNSTTGAFVADVEVTWTVSDGNLGTVIAGPDKSTTFTANLTNGGDLTISATNVTIPQNTNSTGTITINPPNIDFIQIRDVPDGLGQLITEANFNAGESAQYHAAGYNATTGLFVSNVNVIWDVTSIVGTIDIIQGYSTNFTASDAVGITTQGTLKATFNVISDQFTIIVNLPPSKITDLQVTQVTQGSALDLSWTASDEPDVQGYIIYRKVPSATEFVIIKTINDNTTTTFTNTNLGDGVTYTYYIVAFDDGPNNSPNSDEVSATSDLDSDGDGIFNILDPDDDNDGLSDEEEENPGEDGYQTDPLNPDSDGDGYNDSEDFYPLDETKWEIGDVTEPEDFPMIIIFIIILVVVILLILLMLTRRRKPEEELMPESEDAQLPPVVVEEPYEEELFPEETLEEEEPEEEVFEEDQEGISDLEFECPECGFPVSDSVSKCPECGTEFEEEEEEDEELELEL